MKLWGGADLDSGLDSVWITQLSGKTKYISCNGSLGEPHGGAELDPQVRVQCVLEGSDPKGTTRVLLCNLGWL